MQNIFSKKQGFTLVEIMIVVAIIGIITAISIPALLRGRLNANESATKANLRTFSSAAEAYRSAQAAPSYPADIGNLTSAAPAYLDTTWGATMTATKSGYVITYDFAGAAQYAIYAEPSLAAITGNNSFCIDETGVAWISATAAGAFSGAPCSGGTGASLLQ